MNHTDINPRWHGLPLILGGLVMGAALLFHPNEGANPDALATVHWAIVHGMLLAGAIAVLLGLPAVAQRTPGALGLAGYLLTFITIAFFIFAFALEAFVVPVLANANPNTALLLLPDGPLFGGPLGLLMLVIGVGYTAGSILLGSAILRAGTLPRSTGVLLIVSSLVSLVPPLPFVVMPVSGVLLGLAFAGAGWAIWSRPMLQMQMAHA